MFVFTHIKCTKRDFKRRADRCPGSPGPEACVLRVYASVCLCYKYSIGNGSRSLCVCVFRTKAGSACFQDVFLEDGWEGPHLSVAVPADIPKPIWTYRSFETEDFFSLLLFPPLFNAQSLPKHAVKV